MARFLVVVTPRIKRRPYLVEAHDRRDAINRVAKEHDTADEDAFEVYDLNALAPPEEE